MGRNEIRHQLEEDKHYRYIEHSVPPNVVEAANQLFIKYQEEEQDLHFGNLELKETSEKYELVWDLMRTQQGGGVHGQIVLLGLSALTHYLEEYDSIRGCFDNVQLEGFYDGLKPDIFDTDNRVILEAGFVTGFRESQNAWLDKAISYEKARLSHNDKEMKYLQIPKSSFGNSAYDTGTHKVRKIDENSFSMYEIRFTESFRSKIESNADGRTELDVLQD